MPQMNITVLNVFAYPYEIFTIKGTILVIEISIINHKCVKIIIQIFILYTVKPWSHFADREGLVV